MHDEGSSTGPSKACGGAFMAFTISGSLLSSPFQGLERRLQGVPVGCSVLYNMHHDGSSSGPGRTWGVVFMAFTISGNLLSSPFQGLERRLHVFLFSALCGCTIRTMKALPRPFMAFKLAKVLGNSHATHGSGLALKNCIVADHSQL